jgi:MFS family permease
MDSSPTIDRAGIRNYAIVTVAYWGFTITDGALRMLVLLYFHTLGYTPLEVAMLFLFYEIFGIVTNLFGGWIGSRFGVKLTLYSGIALQIGALLMLTPVNETWALAVAVPYVMVAQAFSGIAKDLTKMSSKSAIRLVIPQNAQSALFKWVAILTGSKNALKGVGFFLGSLLLAVFGYVTALLIMAVGLMAVLVSGLWLPSGMGKVKTKVKFSQLFSKTREINILSAARFFLFGARDVWFVVGLPVFLYSVLNWSFEQVGGFLSHLGNWLWHGAVVSTHLTASVWLRSPASGQHNSVLDWAPDGDSGFHCDRSAARPSPRANDCGGLDDVWRGVCLQLSGAFVPGTGLHRR